MQNEQPNKILMRSPTTFLEIISPSTIIKGPFEDIVS
jgi:hypothetical protein